MAAPGGPGNGPGHALAVQQGQYSHAGAIAILAREIPLENVSRLDIVVERQNGSEPREVESLRRAKGLADAKVYALETELLKARSEMLGVTEELRETQVDLATIRMAAGSA